MNVVETEEDVQNEILDENEPPKKRKKISKVPNVQVILLKPNDFFSFKERKLMLPELKAICKHFCLKLTGNKTVLVDRIYTYLQQSFYAQKIQSCFRGFLLRQLFYYSGPAFRNKSICVNDTDFITLEPLSEIPNEQFFSFKDFDEFVYGFDVVSLYNMIVENNKSNKPTLNPYNRTAFSEDFFEKFQNFLSINKALKNKIDFVIENSCNLSTKSKIELKALEIFQLINSYGHYSDSKWLMTLDSTMLTRFLMKLSRIWDFLPLPTTRLILPPDGYIFRNAPSFQANDSLEETQQKVLMIIERLVTRGHTIENRNLGAFYVLGALTLVNREAATAMPWLYESFI